MIDSLVCVTTELTLAILLCLIYLCVDFIAAIRRDSVSLLRFPFFCDNQDFSCEISFVCRMKCPYNCFSAYFVSSHRCSVDHYVVSGRIILSLLFL